MKKLIVALAVCFLLYGSGLSRAQDNKLPPYEGESLIIWNTNALGAPQGLTAYLFTVDTQDFCVSRDGTTTLNDLVIVTNFGNIEFSHQFDCSDAGRFGDGLLLSAEEFQSLNILSASATVNVKKYDFSSKIAVKEFKPLKLSVASTNNSSCPSKSEQLPPIEATFSDFVCGDYCHLSVKLDNGQDGEFLAGGDIQEVVETPNSVYKPGTRIRLTLEENQWEEPEGDPSEACMQAVVATSISVINATAKRHS
jgi:hypothetical protein